MYKTSHRVPFKCSDKNCLKRFSVKTDSVLAESKISLQKWLLAIYFIGYSKKGVSSVELGEKLGVTQKTAWFLGHRIRQACIDFATLLGGTVELDETFIGGKEKNKHSSKKKGVKGTEGKDAVMGGISRESKQVVAYPVKEVSHPIAEIFITNNVKKNSMMYADDANCYNGLVPLRVKHSKGEYVRYIKEQDENEKRKGNR